MNKTGYGYTFSYSSRIKSERPPIRGMRTQSSSAKFFEIDAGGDNGCP